MKQPCLAVKACQQHKYLIVLYIEKSLKHKINRMRGLIKLNQSITFIPQKNADKRKSSTMTQKIHDTFGNIFNSIGSFKGTFSLQLKPDSKPY